ncbi:hypothetical protein [Ruegeria sp.]|uniref:hypothetical protein n=1 Tax=Ruegeria sp. TaxID=1879320 RepID=UPI003B5A6065
MTHTLDQRHIASLRWSILRTAMVGGHLGVTDRMCLDVGRAEYLGVTLECIRNELDYLETRGLLVLERSDLRAWRAKLTRGGRDVVDYEVPAEAGITRPPRLADGEG